jgi:hypothetical protein
MDLSPQDASAALDEIDSAERRARERLGYRKASPFLILWGLIWFFANAAGDLLPVYDEYAWPLASTFGGVVSIVMVLLQMRRQADVQQSTAAQQAVAGRRMFLLGIALCGYFPAMFTVLGDLDGRQQNAFISLFWAFAYMVAGAWLGMRMFITGVVMAVAILVGYLFIDPHFQLWMAFVGGGSLLLAGFWLRKT